MITIMKVNNSTVLQIEGHNVLCKDIFTAEGLREDWRYSDMEVEEFISHCNKTQGCLYLNNKGMKGLA